MPIIISGCRTNDVDGSEQNDLILGSRRADVIDAGAGDDVALGWRGDDVIIGGEGDDYVSGGRGDDILYGDGVGAGAPGVNLITNGSFEDTTGMRETEFGFKGEVPGWTNSGDGIAEVVSDGWVDMPASDGDYYLDTGALRDEVLDISQTVEGVEEGQTYVLSFDAGQWQEPSPAPDETLNVYWNGELIASIHPEAVDSYESFSFEVVGGSGDGSNTLRFEGVTDGSYDSQGVVIDNVSLVAQADEGQGDDTLLGGAGDDQMFGGGGDDLLKGGDGDDVSTGGAGADIFAYDDRDGSDVITDFTFGEDKIQLDGGKGFGCGLFSFFFGGGRSDFDDLTFTQVEDDVAIEFGQTTILVEDAEVASFSESDFIFV